MTITLRKDKDDSLSWSEMDTNFETLRDAIPPAQFVNFCPAAGLPANRTALGEIPVYADFTFSRKESVTPTPVMIDREDQEVMFVMATNGKVVPQLYRAVRSSNTQPFIFSNVGLRTPWMKATENTAAMYSLSTNSTSIATYDSVTRTNKFYVIKINGSSDANTWTDYVDITSEYQIGGRTARSYMYDPASNRIIGMYITDDSKAWLRVLNMNLQPVRPDQMLMDIRLDMNWIDKTGAWAVVPNSQVYGYTLNTIPCTYDASSETLYFVGRVQAAVNSLQGGINSYVSAPFCSSWSLPKSVLVNNTGAPANLLAYNRENPAQYDAWDWNAIGTFARIGDAGFSIGFDDYYKAVYVNGNPYWDNGASINIYKLSTPTRLANLNKAVLDSHSTVAIPDASLWAKGVNQSMLLMGNTMQFCGSSSAAIANIEAKVSTTQFATSNSPNDTFVILPNTEQKVRSIYTVEEADLLENLNRMCTVVTPAGLPLVYTCKGPGNPIIQITQGVDRKHFIPTGVTLPDFPANSYVWYFSWGWDGNIASPTFYYHAAPLNQPVETTNYSRVVKYHAGVWTESPTIPAKDFWDASKANRGTAVLGWSFGTTYTQSSQKLGFGFVVGNSGGVYQPVIMTMKSDMTISNRIALDDPYLQSGVANAFMIGYHESYGYYAGNASLSLGGGKAANFRTSKNFGVDAQSYTEVEFFEQSKYFLRYITIAPATGLIAYVLPYPLLLGGYFSYIPKTDVVLEPNSVNYIYLRRSPTDSTKIVVLVLQNQLLPNSFSRVLAAKVTTNATSVVSAEMTPF